MAEGELGPRMHEIGEREGLCVHRAVGHSLGQEGHGPTGRVWLEIEVQGSRAVVGIGMLGGDGSSEVIQV